MAMDMDMSTANGEPDVLSHHIGMSVECDGSIDPSRKGSWKGHVLPGLLFIVWGTWWLLQTYHRAAYAQARGQRFRSRSFFCLPGRRGHWVEPALKVLAPVVAVSMELYLDHHGHFRYLYCPSGSKYAGRFALTHMNNWQHAISYPGFVMSGLVDLLGAYVTFPKNTSRALLAYAFFAMAFIMGLHEKHDAMDKAVHFLLFIAMSTAALGVLLEAARPRSPICAVARAVAVIMLGAWFWQAGVIEFEDHPQWTEEYIGGAMLTPVAYIGIFSGVVFSAILAYVPFAVLAERNALPHPIVGGEDDDEDDDDDATLALARAKLLARAGAGAEPLPGSDEDSPLVQGLSAPHPRAASRGRQLAKSPGSSQDSSLVEGKDAWSPVPPPSGTRGTRNLAAFDLEEGNKP